MCSGHKTQDYMFKIALINKLLFRLVIQICSRRNRQPTLWARGLTCLLIEPPSQDRALISQKRLNSDRIFCLIVIVSFFRSTPKLTSQSTLLVWSTQSMFLAPSRYLGNLWDKLHIRNFDKIWRSSSLKLEKIKSCSSKCFITMHLLTKQAVFMRQDEYIIYMHHSRTQINVKYKHELL